MTQDRAAGMDPGFGGFKAAFVGDPELDGLTSHVHHGIRVVTLPAVVGTGNTEMGLLSMAGIGGRRKRNEPRHVAFDQTELLVGNNVADYGRPVERLDMGRLQNGPELRALTYATLGELFGAGTTKAGLVVGYPVEVLEGKEAQATIRALRKWLIGTHNFTIDGEFHQMTITKIKAVAQPLGSYLAWGLDNAGTWARPKSDVKAPVGILDVGFNTLDLFAVKGGQITRRFTGGQNLGMRRVANSLSDLIQRSFDRTLYLAEADALVRACVASRKDRAMLAVPGGETDVGQLVRTALDLAAGEALAYCERMWGNGSQFSHILLTGGGAKPYGPALVRHFSHAVIMPDPVTANAQGLAKLAQRPNFLK